MKSKQTKDYMDNIDKPGLSGETSKLRVEQDYLPYQKINIDGEDVYLIDINKIPKGSDFDIDKWIKIMKERPMEIVNTPYTTLKGFITKFVRPNSLIRLWYEVEGGHQTVLSDNDSVEMEWSIVKGEGLYKGYENNLVKGVTDIVVSGNYSEAINIVIWK